MEVRKLNIHTRKDLHQQWINLLNQAGIRHEENVELVLGVYEDDQLIATGSIHQNILKCIAVCEKHTGGKVLNLLITHLMNAVSERGYPSMYVYTKPASVASFEHLGFKEIGRVRDELVFMERAVRGFSDYLDSLKPYRKAGANGAIVMNANPFTKGHQYLIETASQTMEHVYVFVLSEDASAFPADIRKRLVIAGTSHLNNVTILDTGSYMVSHQTFPSYFLKESSDVTQIQAELDASIFKASIAHVLDIRVRFVGEEPFSEATNIYNTALKSILEPEITLNIIPRKAEGDTIISATRVRKALLENQYEFVKGLVPSSTYEYIVSEEGQRLIEDMRNGGKSIGKV